MQNATRIGARIGERSSTPTRERRADYAVNDAVDLVGAVRNVAPEVVWQTLVAWTRNDPARLYAAVIALAAMVDDSKPVSELLAWTYSLAGREAA